MNTLNNGETNNKLTGGVLVFSAAMLLSACGGKNGRDGENGQIAISAPEGCEISETTSGVNITCDNNPLHPVNEEQEQIPTVPEVVTPIEPIESFEGQVYIDFNINNASLAFVDEETNRTIPGLGGINTDYEGKAFFDLSTLQTQLQSLGNKRLYIIPTGISPVYSSSIDLTNGAQHIITDFSNGIGKILKARDIRDSVNGEINHSARSLTYFQTSIEGYPQEIDYDLHRFNNAVSKVFWEYKADINSDGVTDYFDINENPVFSQYADDCLRINPDGSLSVNFIPTDDLYPHF